MSKSERKNEIILLVIVILIGAFIAWANIPLNIQKIESRFVVMENPGFDLTPGYLGFGGLTQNSSTMRNITITNEFSKKVKIKIETSDDIEGYVFASENNFYLEPSESKTIIFTAKSKNLELGNYSGEISIISKRTFW